MKKVTDLLLGLTLMSLLFIGCSKDEDGDSTQSTGSMTIAGETYDISNGILEYYGSWGASGAPYNIDLVLYSDGITIKEVDGEAEPSGKGNFLYFEILTDTEATLPEGTYTFSDSETAGTFDFSDYGINYDVANDDSDIYDYITAGTITVSKSNNIYTISISLTDSSDNTITGSFSGTLKYFDYSNLSYSVTTTTLKSAKSKNVFLK
ncbi:hypothetical protein [Carboxylicivirga caseinilyticus]|uniref:hypothetical protein n=1 Tax=Carboxylicivirga caseinilyticus TaxID=3417572 RepID=UPI003D33B6C5|nr:hypothetical protein [Marinilabiliaceae bacterium A049]